jgi:pimeloyl-ACP methyl ester carboxylesterase
VRHSYAVYVTLGIRKLEETGPAVLLAESFGGAVALMIAHQRPDLVRRLVLVNTFAYYPRRFTIDVAGLIGPWFPSRPSPDGLRWLRSLFFFAPGTPKDVQNQWWDLTTDVLMSSYGHRLTLVAKLDIRPLLSEVDVPTLVFAAPNDWIVPWVSGKLLAKRLPRARFLTARTSHAGMIDQAVVNIAAWLADDSLWRR